MDDDVLQVAKRIIAAFTDPATRKWVAGLTEEQMNALAALDTLRDDAEWGEVSWLVPGAQPSDDDNGPKTLVFVYGTLLTGEPNHRFLTHARYVAPAVAPGYALYSLGPYPAMAAGDADAFAVGEVWEVGPVTLAALDRLEGHPHHYQRTPITVVAEVGGAGNMSVEAYVRSDTRLAGLPRITDGDWKAHVRRSL